MFEINGILWNIFYVPPTSHHLMRSDKTYALGVTDWNKKSVFIANNQYGDKLEHILCHELCHCACFSWGIHIDVLLEEWLCNFMADHGKEIIYILDDILYSMNRRTA